MRGGDKQKHDDREKLPLERLRHRTLQTIRDKHQSLPCVALVGQEKHANYCRKWLRLERHSLVNQLSRDRGCRRCVIRESFPVNPSRR